MASMGSPDVSVLGGDMELPSLKESWMLESLAFSELTCILDASSEDILACHPLS